MAINPTYQDILLNSTARHEEKQSAKTLWINLVAPSREKVDRLLHSLDLPLDTLNQPRSSLQKKIGDLLLLRLHIPKRNLPYSPIPYQVTLLTILIKGNKVVTILEDETTLLMHLEHEYLVKWAFLDVTSFVYRLLALTTEGFILATKEVERETTQMEEALKRTFNNQSVYQLLNYNKSFLFFAKALKHNYKLLNVIYEQSMLKADYEQDLQLSDLIVETAQAENLARIYNANLRNLMDAYSALIKNNLSLSVQYLTIFITISAIPMSIAALYGMNTPLPFQDEPYALTLLAIITGILILGALLVFRVKRMI
ncbi:magnesium transporter CorA family protein [Ignatzschineria cameli]|uniref:Magnesium transporter CorA family protein n=1 Tax=Ignatzschineria cameli TaxID=2182793 RepID=A0A2U2ATK6_9GAMM|nr:magnesium transporter CorA family protein [Ignatzschineria cameli]PWD88048.1 hypothetical protein DC077_01875 [Ignatzschineria cameli]PWD91080.1 hypothetical protein DC079_02630 [Ignatzschineria cameli]PWD92722.1 hypothetical protein DC081_02630 [Ignatzschineria cameli]PWD93742.1 hypothetical protein DC078_02630 [Ignatzschineria cameli]